MEPTPKPLVFLLGGKKWTWKLAERRKKMLQYDPAGIHHQSGGPTYLDSLSGLTGPHQLASQSSFLHRWQTKASQDFQACLKLPCSTSVGSPGSVFPPSVPNNRRLGHCHVWTFIDGIANFNLLWVQESINIDYTSKGRTKEPWSTNGMLWLSKKLRQWWFQLLCIIKKGSDNKTIEGDKACWFCMQLISNRNAITWQTERNYS